MDTFYKPSYRYSYGIHTVPVMRCFLIATSNCYMWLVCDAGMQGRPWSASNGVHQ